MNILIVESPAKCSKIQGFLGAGWRVQATMGHFRGLKEGLDGIGFQTGWAPIYENLKTKATAVTSLKKLKGTIYLGSDDDREGEAIAWHVCQLLGLPVATTPRVIFHEITKEAITKAVAKPTRINMAVVEAQQARSMLDLLIGFTLSPCLWKGVGYKPGLSAGRCQTPALRIVYDRELQIAAHQTKKTWTLSAMAALKWVCPTAFEEEPDIVELAKDPILLIVDRKDSVSSHKAPAPFITSSLQQEASSRLRMNPKTTMRVAQKLYEQGHITYMRTDSAVLSDEATTKARSLVESRWGEEYLQTISKAKGAEGPHEGIRPTHLETETLSEGDEARLYALIWRRTMQSVMSDHKEAVVRLKGTIATTEFFTESRQTTFSGWRIIGMPAAEDESEGEDPVSVSTLKAGKKLKWASMSAKETLTSPPPRFSEASLIRELEKKGIGRPSTYAALIETVLERGYVEKTKLSKEKVPIKSVEIVAGSPPLRKTEYSEKTKGTGLQVTSLGRTVIEWLLTQFGPLVDYGFTASMERRLDDVASSSLDKTVLLEDIWTSYKDRYSEIMASGSGSGSEAKSKGALGEGYKVVVTKKGPLFVLEGESGAQFAALPPTVSAKTATLADAKAAFADLSGVMLGSLEGKPVLQKKGKYGPYVTWTSPKGSNINLTYGSETFEEVCARLKAKISTDTVDHQIGPFRIKKGPYGLYMFKVLKSAKKPTFISIPADTSWSTLTVEGAEALYKANVKVK